jgi:hypothetical protein
MVKGDDDVEVVIFLVWINFISPFWRSTLSLTSFSTMELNAFETTKTDILLHYEANDYSWG